MAIERWQPFSELMSLRQAMDRLFEDSFVRPSRVLTTLGEAALEDGILTLTIPKAEEVKPKTIKVTAKKEERK